MSANYWSGTQCYSLTRGLQSGASTCLFALALPRRVTDLEPDSYRGTSIEKRLLEAWYTGVIRLADLSEGPKLRNHLDVASCCIGITTEHLQYWSCELGFCALRVFD